MSSKFNYHKKKVKLNLKILYFFLNVKWILKLKLKKRVYLKISKFMVYSKNKIFKSKKF